MNTKLVILSALAMLAAPLAYAHDPAGTPKNYCEPQGEWVVHDYGPPATGSLIVGNEDGNLFGDCDGVVTADPGVLCLGVDPADPVNSFFVGLCDSDINPPVADWDGHNEFALGGAWLLSGPETVECFGADPHHPAFGEYAVVDVVLGNLAPFSVASDTVSLIPDSTCGDFESDESIDCVSDCFVPFPPGLDGAYVAYVTGTLGHVQDGPNPISPPPPQCFDGVDNDGNGATDWPDDPGCDSPLDDDESDDGFPPECSDGIDNDGDGLADWPNDPECDSPLDDDESTASVCSDGIDNDGDGFVDFGADPECATPGDNDEANL